MIAITSGRVFDAGQNAPCGTCGSNFSRGLKKPGWNQAPPLAFVEPVKIMISQQNQAVRLAPDDIPIPVPVS